MTKKPSDIIEDNLDVLQRIEGTIATTFNAHPRLTDKEVDNALNALVREYETRVNQKPVTIMRLTRDEVAVFQNVMDVVEARFGTIDSGASADEVIACLTHMRRSIKFWSTKNGAQGYVRFVTKYNND